MDRNGNITQDTFELAVQLQPTEEIARIANAMVEGRLDERCNASQFSGESRVLIDQINSMLNTLISPLHLTAHAIDEIAHGKIPDFIIEEYKGEYNQIKLNLNTLLATLYGIHYETQTLVSSIKEGRLDARGNDWDFSGNWKNLIGGVNETLDAVIDPVHEASKILGQLSEYKLGSRMHGKYHGDHATIKKVLNKTGDSLAQAISKVSESVTNVRAAVVNISEKVELVSSGATEQARAIEETSENLMQISVTFQQAVSNTQEAKINVQRSQDSMVTAKEVMVKMSDAMGEIRLSTDSTVVIVQEINEITKQTDILATSAAGKAEKVRSSAGGFGIVAMEIRRLSVRCDEAATTLKGMLKTNTLEQSEKENEKLQTIIDDLDEIAMLSNFLGVNAAIEAAHVEAAGQAFETLTDEVRLLAKRSAESASKTEKLINQSVDLTKKGEMITQELDGHLDVIFQATQNVGRMTDEISLATNDGATRIEEINMAVQDIDKVTTQNITAARGSMMAIKELEQQTVELDTLVKKFIF